MNRDEQLKELFRKHWEKSEEERRAELVELGVIQEEKSETYKEGYNKAIDDFAEKLKEYTYGRTNGIYVEIPLYKFDEITEQLKECGTNERV